MGLTQCSDRQCLAPSWTGGSLQYTKGTEPWKDSVACSRNNRELQRLHPQVGLEMECGWLQCRCQCSRWTLTSGQLLNSNSRVLLPLCSFASRTPQAGKSEQGAVGGGSGGCKHGAPDVQLSTRSCDQRSFARTILHIRLGMMHSCLAWSIQRQMQSFVTNLQGTLRLNRLCCELANVALPGCHAVAQLRMYAAH